MRTPKLLLALVVATGLVLAACGDDSSTATDDTTATTAGSTTSVAATVAVATGSAIGDHLVDAQGRTLYLFEKDQGTTTACTAACSTNWPAVTVNGDPVAGSGVDQAKLAKADSGQVTYNGHLLYLFAGDKVPGDTNGTKIASWYAVDAQGSAIELDEAEGAATTAPVTTKAAAKAPATTQAPATTADDDMGYGY
jgi:predicted lipoprotein with Yx(FWY)xxD motif